MIVLPEIVLNEQGGVTVPAVIAPCPHCGSHRKIKWYWYDLKPGPPDEASCECGWSYKLEARDAS